MVWHPFLYHVRTRTRLRVLHVDAVDALSISGTSVFQFFGWYSAAESVHDTGQSRSMRRFWWLVRITPFAFPSDCGLVASLAMGANQRRLACRTLNLVSPARSVCPSTLLAGKKTIGDGAGWGPCLAGSLASLQCRPSQRGWRRTTKARTTMQSLRWVEGSGL